MDSAPKNNILNEPIPWLSRLRFRSVVGYLWIQTMPLPWQSGHVWVIFKDMIKHVKLENVFSLEEYLSYQCRQL